MDDRLGSTTNLTDKFGRVVGRADYNEWGEITYREALTITSSYRRIYPQSSYTGHDWDDVLGMYYAKARFYSAEDKRFVSMDPVKGNITNPLSLVPYVYCVDNPLRWMDPLGLIPGRANMVNTMVSDTGNGQRQTQKGTVDKSVLLEKKAELQKSEQVSAGEKAKGNSKTIAKPAVTHKSALIPVVWFEYFLPTLPFILIPIYELDSFDGCLPSEGLAAFDRLCDDIFAAFIQYGIDGIDSIGSQSQLGALMDLAIGVAVDTIYCTVEKISASDYFSSLRCEALAKIQANQEESRKSWCVYVLLDQRPSGTVIYVGMTSNANKREDQHRRSPKVQLYPNLALFVLRSGLKDRTEARVCEQVYMTVFFPEIYNAHLNKVRSISQYKLSHNQTKLTALLNFVGDVAENELLSAMEEVEF